MSRSALVASLLCALLSLGTRPSFADVGWFEWGDTLLRLDLQLLNDTEVLGLPVSRWPMPRAAVRDTIDQAKEHIATNSGLKAALERVRRRLSTRDGLGVEGRVSGGEPGICRDIGAPAREHGELGAEVTENGERFAAKLSISTFAYPKDGREFRADRSHAAVQLGNWLVSAHTFHRFWGLAHESSPIHSNNTRPIPTVTPKRATAQAFNTPWLSNGALWSATARSSLFNRDDFGDARELVSSVPADYHALDLAWTEKPWGETLSVGLGVERYAPAIDSSDVDPDGSVVWRHESH